MFLMFLRLLESRDYCFFLRVLKALGTLRASKAPKMLRTLRTLRFLSSLLNSSSKTAPKERHLDFHISSVTESPPHACDQTQGQLNRMTVEDSNRCSG